jgi:hypothetical protein
MPVKKLEDISPLTPDVAQSVQKSTNTQYSELIKLLQDLTGPKNSKFVPLATKKIVAKVPEIRQAKPKEKFQLKAKVSAPIGLTISAINPESPRIPKMPKRKIMVS